MGRRLTKTKTKSLKRRKTPLKRLGVRKITKVSKKRVAKRRLAKKRQTAAKRRVGVRGTPRKSKRAPVRQIDHMLRVLEEAWGQREQTVQPCFYTSWTSTGLQKYLFVLSDLWNSELISHSPPVVLPNIDEACDILQKRNHVTRTWIQRNIDYIRNLPTWQAAVIDFYKTDSKPINDWTSANPNEQTAALAYQLLRSYTDKQSIQMGMGGEIIFRYTQKNLLQLPLQLMTWDRPSEPTGRPTLNAVRFLDVLSSVANKIISEGPPLDKDVEVYRGDSRGLTPIPPGSRGTVSIPKILSTSTNSLVTYPFMENALEKNQTGYFTQIHLPAGTRCLYYEPEGPESEIMLPAGSCFLLQVSWHPFDYMDPFFLNDNGRRKPDAIRIASLIQKGTMSLVPCE